MLEDSDINEDLKIINKTLKDNKPPNSPAGQLEFCYFLALINVNKVWKGFRIGVTFVKIFDFIEPSLYSYFLRCSVISIGYFVCPLCSSKGWRLTYILERRLSFDYVTSKGDISGHSSASSSPSVVREARIESGKLFYEKRWFHRGQAVHVEQVTHPNQVLSALRSF